ncbi:MAG: hypothetical protein ACRDKJ_14305 [Actinomycetota bacterium]
MSLALGAAAAIIGSALLVLRPYPSVAAQDEPTEASDLLARMASTGDATYQARQLVVYFGRPQSAAVIDLRSSEKGHFLRAESGSDVTRLWRRRDMRLVSDAGGTITEAAPAALGLDPAAVLAKFDVEVERPASLLGVRVVPLSLVRRSDGAAVERLWVHADSGVVYRRELYGVGGKLVGLAAILDMRWGRDEPAEPYEPGSGEVSRALGARSADAPSMLPNGYRLRRGYRIAIDDRPTEHWLYSDGLHALSIFRTPGGLRPPDGFAKTDLGGTAGWTGPGPGTWAWEGGGASWVVVAEEPGLDPVRLTEPLPKGGRSAWARMGSLWSGALRAIGDLFS